MDTKHPASALHDGQSPIEKSGALGVWGGAAPHTRTQQREQPVLEPSRPQTDALENDGASRCVLGGGFALGIRGTFNQPQCDLE